MELKMEDKLIDGLEFVNNTLNLIWRHYMNNTRPTEYKVS